MKNKNKYYIFFRRELPLKPCADIAHYIHDVQCANAALNLGHKAVMVYCNESSKLNKVFKFVFPFQLKKAGKQFQDFYGASRELDMVAIPSKNPLLLTKYYFPFHVAPRAKLVHTQDFLIAETAARCKVPVVYEQHYLQKYSFKKDVVQNHFFKLAVCQSEITHQNLIKNGMPEDKVVCMHNGFNPVFLTRQPDKAKEWRNELLNTNERYLAVYSGALYGFKGIDTIIKTAEKLPDIKFVLTGGTNKQLMHYRELAKDIKNIIFLGWLKPRSRLISLFQAADVMLHPHLSRHGDYTDPVKFFQYLASGTPIVATDLPFLSEFRSQNLALTICKPDNVYEFVRGVSEAILKYPKKIEGYAENVELAKQFTWEKRMEKIFVRVIEFDKQT